MYQLFPIKQTHRPTLKIRSCLYKLLAISTALILTACGGSGSGGDSTPAAPPSPSATYSVGGNIGGLSAAGLVLQNNAGDDLTIAANATSFQFATSIAAGGDYAVTVATQPAGLICTVSHGNGSNVNAAVTNVSVICSASTHTIAGTITGLTTTGLVLRNNGADDLAIAANATTFQFSTPIADGSGYSVTAFAQPAGLTCTVSNGVGSDVTTNIHNINIACSVVTVTVGGTITGLTGSGLVLQNNSGDNLTIAANATAFEFATAVAYGGGYAVTILTQPAGEFCSITNASNIATAQVNDVALICSQTTLTPSVLALALSVNDTTLGADLTGTPRQITITNNGSSAAHNVSISYPTWPMSTTASSTCSTTLAAGASCAITVTPGANATSSCDIGFAPTPGTITVAADDAPTNTVDVVVLSYGCIYQAGYIYAVDDTTSNSSSIGGKVISLTDQAAPYLPSGPQAGGALWSSNGVSGSPGDISYDTIPGIDETSTVSSGSPTYAASQTIFNSTYSANSTDPFPDSSSFRACNGASDGACNTSNILAFYNQYITNYGLSPLAPGPTALSYYAAGSCSQTIGGYADWYLPAVCEMGPAAGGLSCPVGAANAANNLPNLVGDPNAGAPGTSCALGANCLAGIYWSSTLDSGAPQGN
ncbi:MAG TPA: hypothetical protein VLC91_06230, partial [Spongiibacteraceae bacterium]|nr:hypothetical protein [Spongiibacteraceae bacterium]